MGLFKVNKFFNNLLFTATDFWRLGVIQGLVSNLAFYLLIFWEGHKYQDESWFCLGRCQDRNWYSVAQFLQGLSNQ